MLETSVNPLTEIGVRRQDVPQEQLSKDSSTSSILAPVCFHKCGLVTLQSKYENIGSALRSSAFLDLLRLGTFGGFNDFTETLRLD